MIYFDLPLVLVVLTISIMLARTPSALSSSPVLTDSGGRDPSAKNRTLDFDRS